MIYLDHAATTAAYPEVVSEMTPYLDRQYFNPSGLLPGRQTSAQKAG